MGDRDVGEGWSSEGRTDTRNDERFETVLAEVEDLLACTTIDDWVALF